MSQRLRDERIKDEWPNTLRLMNVNLINIISFLFAMYWRGNGAGFKTVQRKRNGKRGKGGGDEAVWPFPSQGG